MKKHLLSMLVGSIVTLLALAILFVAAPMQLSDSEATAAISAAVAYKLHGDLEPPQSSIKLSVEGGAGALEIADFLESENKGYEFEAFKQCSKHELCAELQVKAEAKSQAKCDWQQAVNLSVEPLFGSMVAIVHMGGFWREHFLVASVFGKWWVVSRHMGVVVN